MDRETKLGIMIMSVLVVGVFVLPFFLKSMGAW